MFSDEYDSTNLIVIADAFMTLIRSCMSWGATQMMQWPMCLIYSVGAAYSARLRFLILCYCTKLMSIHQYWYQTHGHLCFPLPSSEISKLCGPVFATDLLVAIQIGKLNFSN